MATLTPAELATLLGPQLATEIKIAPASVADSNRWAEFAARLAKSLTARLRPLIRAAARVQPNGAARLTVAAILADNDYATISEVWQSSRSDEPLALTISLPLVAAFVDRLLGGGSNPVTETSSEQRSLSDTDRQFAVRLIEAIRQSFTESLPSTTDAAAGSLDPLTTRLSESWLSDCELVRLTFDVRFVQGTGSFDLLLPVDFAESLTDASPSRHESELLPLSASDHLASPRIANAERSVNAKRITVRLAQTTLAASDLNNLAIGDVLLTDTDATQPCEVLINDHPTFLATPGQFNNHKAAQLLQAISDYSSRDQV